MKSLDPPYSPLVASLIVLTILVAIYQPFSYAAYFDDDCCPPPTLPPAAARFQQDAVVIVYIPNNSGLTTDEIAAIKVAMEDWNDEPNNSNVDYNVVEANRQVNRLTIR